MATELAQNDSPRARLYPVLLGNRDRVEAALQGLNKRAVKKGLPLLAWTWGKPYVETFHRETPDGSSQKIVVSRADLTILGDAPSYGGWTFVAALQHLDGENIVRTVPGQTVPKQYRSRGPVCDHCKAIRRRNDTFVVRHEDGHLLQVGSTCLGDFLGSDTAGDIAASASLLAAACDIAASGDDDGMGGGSRGQSAFAMSEYLPLVAWSVREQGWLSRTAAREQMDQGASATADSAWVYLTDDKARNKAGAKPSEQDIDLATKAEAWAESLSDAAVDAGSGDYLHNLRAVARSGLATFRTIGIAASMIVAYERSVAQARQAAERLARPASPVLDAHVGVVGERSTFVVTLDFVTGYDSQFGYVTVLKFKTSEGATVVWKSTGSSAPVNVVCAPLQSAELSRQDVGKVYTITGMVKAHGDYKGQKQTIVARCKIVEGVVAAPAPKAPRKSKKAVVS